MSSLYNYSCNKGRGGDACLNSIGAFGIPKNKALIGLVVLDFFFFGLEGFPIDSSS
jgi:hypothetical protein